MPSHCRHRMSVLLDGRGHTRLITCPCNARTYALDGWLRGGAVRAFID